MVYCRKGMNFKKNKNYKTIRRLLIEMLDQNPDYTDRIVNGVSFKWYLHNIVYYEGLKELLIRYISMEFPDGYDVKVKIIKYPAKIIRDEFSPFIYKRFSGDSLRILVKQ